MKNITRVLNKKKSKQGERRKHNSVSSLPEPVGSGGLTTVAATGPIIAITPGTSSQAIKTTPASATGWSRPMDSPTHHIMSIHTPPRRDSGPNSYGNLTTQEAWTVKTNGTVTLSVSSPASTSMTHVPKVSIVEDMQAPRDREDMISITKDVQKFLAAISQLRQAVEEMDSHRQDCMVRILDNDKDTNIEQDEADGEEEEFLRAQDEVIDQLRELVHVVECCLDSNPSMQSTELTNTSKKLLQTYKSCDHGNGKVSECGVCNQAIDSLVDTFTQCVSDYMAGEISDPAGGINALMNMGGGAKAKPQTLGVPLNKGMQSSKSHDNLARFSSSVDLTQANEPIVDTIDQALSTIENSVEVASAYIKFRQKYYKEIVGYLTRRAQIEQRYYSQLSKAVKQTQATLSELHQQEEFLPLYDVFRNSLEEDNRYAMNCNTTFVLQTGHKVLEPLELKIQESERIRKDLMNNWIKERKKLLEAKGSMKHAKAKYIFYGQEVARAKNQLASEPFGKQADRRKKEVTDLEAKFQDSEHTYKMAIAHCNDCQYQVHATAQKSILCAFRRIIVGLDTALKAGLESYYQLQHNFFQSLPDPLLNSMEETKDYEAGSEFLSFIERHPRVSEELEDYLFEEFDPESEVLDAAEEGEGSETGLPHVQSSVTLPTSRPLSPSWEPTIFKAILPSIRMESPSPKPTRPKSVAILDYESPSKTPSSNLQRRNSEKNVTSSPFVTANGAALADDTIVYSKMAKTHSFKKLRTPSRCRGCDTYVYFHGFECEICGLSCHKKCLTSLAIRCGNKKLPRKMNTFGVEFRDHLKATKRLIPIIVTKCINEIDERGLNTQGLYRISSAKSKMEKLCQLFEAGSERVDLSDLAPHLIGSCLKLYLRQLPEPLLTFSLYQEFITFAREASLYLPCNFSKASKEDETRAREILARLEGLIACLPESNQLTLARLMYHLHRVSSPEHVKTNCMPPSNIGIVFGPNLLRQKEMLPSLALLANMSYQAKAIEIMVAHAHEIFHIPEEEIKQLEMESCEDNEDLSMSDERLVGDLEGSPEKRAVLSVDDDDENKRITDTRTPYSTPPEQRRHNVEELHEMVEEFGQNSLASPLRPRGFTQPPPHASPLLMDSRNMWDRRGDTETCALTLPGTLDEQCFSESMLDIFNRKLRLHQASGTMEPLLEREDCREEDGDTPITSTPSKSRLPSRYSQRRRAHSLSKSTGSERDLTQREDTTTSSYENVFQSSTALGNPNQRLFLSEDNLLHVQMSRGVVDSSHTLQEEEEEGHSFESGILKIMSGDGRSSADSSDSQEYKPFQSPNVQALLLPTHSCHSDSAHQKDLLYPQETLPARSLPRNFRRPPIPLPPMRQMSEGQISKSLKSPHFMVGSPPLSSPVSIDKSMSVPSSSRGSFSESYMEELSETSQEMRRDEQQPSLSSKRLSSSSSSSGGGGGRRNTADYSEKIIFIRPKKLLPVSSSQQTHEETQRPVSSGSTEEELVPSLLDIPLPDDSPQVIKSNPYRLATSRDSGLSDSPDLCIDLYSPSHRHGTVVGGNTKREDQPDQTTDQLTLSGNNKPHPSPLINDSKTGITLKKGMTPASSTSVTIQRAKSAKSARITRHVMRVMKSLDLDDRPPPSLSSVDAHEEDSSAPVPEERLRMVSPDVIFSPSDEETGGDWNLKRSKSHAEGVYPRLSEEIEEDETRVGGLIISEAKVGRKISRVTTVGGAAAAATNSSMGDKSLSKSIDVLF